MNDSDGRSFAQLLLFRIVPPQPSAQTCVLSNNQGLPLWASCSLCHWEWSFFYISTSLYSLLHSAEHILECDFEFKTDHQRIKIKENLNLGLSLSLSLNINLKSNFAAGGSFLRRIWRITNGPRSASVNGNPSPHKLPTTPQTFFSVRPTHNVPQNWIHTTMVSENTAI